MNCSAARAVINNLWARAYARVNAALPSAWTMNNVKNNAPRTLRIFRIDQKRRSADHLAPGDEPSWIQLALARLASSLGPCELSDPVTVYVCVRARSSEPLSLCMCVCVCVRSHCELASL